jgi:hypothetical protein
MAIAPIGHDRAASSAALSSLSETSSEATPERIELEELRRGLEAGAEAATQLLIYLYSVHG